MASGFASSVNTQCERKVFGRTDFTAPATLFAAAFVAGTEVTGNGYARVSVANNTTSFPAVSPLVNGIAIDFPTATPSGWGNVNSIRFYDASSAGNEVGRSADFSAVSVTAGGVLHIQTGSITITVSGT
jgi:hypothetical protein